MFQANPEHNAVIERKLFSPTWEFDAGDKINGGLAVAGNTLIFGTFQGDVVALDAYHGTTLWRRHLPNVVMSTPVVADGIAIVGTGRNGRLHPPGDTKYTYLPGVGGDLTWGRPQGDAIVGLDVQSGETLWTFKTTGENMPSAAIADGMAVFANGDLHAYGLKMATGVRAWQRSLDGPATMASATLADGNIYVSVCHEGPYRCDTTALSPRTGALLWGVPYGNSDSAPTCGGGEVFLSGAVYDSRIYSQGGHLAVTAVDAKTGRLHWHYESKFSGPFTQIGSSERAITGTYWNSTYFQPDPTADQLIAFDAETGRVRWRMKSTSPIKMSPIIWRGRLIVGDTSGILYIVDASTGTLVTARVFSKPFTTSPPIAIGSDLILANDSIVYAIPLR